MKKNFYYVYLHTRNDTGRVFYVGMSLSKNGRYTRSYRGVRRNKKYDEICAECGNDITITIPYKFESKYECMKKEKELIAKHQLLAKENGYEVANIDKGGHAPSGGATRVCQYSKKGKLICIWDSGQKAARHFGVSFKAISQSIHSRGLCAGYLWKWHDGKVVVKIEEYRNDTLRKVSQYTLLGEFIMSFESTAEAAKLTGIDRASINNVLLKKRESAGGFLWSDTGTPPEHKKNKKIYQYDFSGNLLNTYPCLEHAVKALGLNSKTAIKNCFIGKQKQAYGFIWKRQ